MADSLSYARMIDAFPNVANTSDRDARFPTPNTYQKIFVQSLNSIQQWDGAAWVTVFTGVAGVAAYLFASTGSPEGVQVAPVGSIYLQTDGTNGGVLWVKNTGVENTGWRLLQTSLGIFNAKDYGATGDGVTNDTATLQAALTAAAVSGGQVLLPAGTYLYTHLTVAANVTLCGAGRGVPLLKRLGLGPEVGSERLFGVRLSGNFAGIRDLSLRGLWNPADPTTQTFDFNIQVMGDNVSHTLTENVETYNAHEGYNIGGVIGNAASYGGQNYNAVVNCYAHDTYDLGFGFVAKDRTTNTNHGCSITNSRAVASYAQAGMEIRFQTGTQVTGFYASDCTNVNGGAGIRLEETNNVMIQGFHATNCGFGLEVINDSYNCTINGLQTRTCQYGAFLSSCADITITDFIIKDSGLDGISLGTATVAAGWTRNNERITLSDGSVDTTGVTGTGNGIEVFGILATADAAKVTNGTDLKITNVTVRNADIDGIHIQAGGRFQLNNVTVQDCGDGTGNFAGIIILYPTVNGVDNTTAPLQGIADNITFINTGVMPRPWYDAHSLVYQGRFRFVGTFANIPQLRFGGDLNTRYNVRYDANLAEGLHLYNTTTALPSPRLFLGNLADANGVSLKSNGGALEVATGATPDGSGGSGTTRLTLTASQLTNTGNLNNGSNTGTAVSVFLNSAAANFRTVQFNTAGVNRWQLNANSTAEAGANAGTNLDIRAYDDTGVLIDIPLAIARVAGGLATWVRRLVAPRLIGNGTAHVAGDYALSAGWGTTATVSTVAARDTGGRVSITCNGASIAANPTVTLTWKDGTWTTIPAVVASRSDAVMPAGPFLVTTPAVTTCVFTFNGLPVAGSIYVFDFIVIGK